MLTVGIIGLGRMGKLLAKRIDGHCSLLLYDRDQENASRVGSGLSASVVNIGQLVHADMIILALPTVAVLPAAKELLAVLSRTDQVLVNIATSQNTKQLADIVDHRAKVVSAKIIGHAKEIEQGEIPVIMVDGPDEDAIIMVADIFKSLGNVEQGPEDLVQSLNALASAEGVRAAYRIRRKMQVEQIPERFWETAVRNVAAGTMKAFASGDVGPFARQVIDEMEGEDEH